jgi:5-methyltetrahydropteroyltriglutamate--homocysteine methyltransferase
VLTLLVEEQQGHLPDRKVIDASIRDAVAEVVNKQVESGLDIINDGKQGRVDYKVYIKDRLTGFEGESTPPIGDGDEEVPELVAILRQFASPFQKRPTCSGPIMWKDWPAVEQDLENLKVATAGAPVQEVFMTSHSPGQIARFQHNRYYPAEEEYLYALAEVMKPQYRAITQAGFLLQLDCPDLALSRHTLFAHLNWRSSGKSLRCTWRCLTTP